MRCDLCKGTRRKLLYEYGDAVAVTWCECSDDCINALELGLRWLHYRAKYSCLKCGQDARKWDCGNKSNMKTIKRERIGKDGKGRVLKLALNLYIRKASPISRTPAI